jgi:DNA-binding PadR family transcriptional regulator
VQPGGYHQSLTVQEEFSLGMNTAGKSDVFEAVIQILILSALQEHGASKSEWLVRDLQRRISGVDCVEEHSLYIALTKLEVSGWVRRGISGPTARRSEKWELTRSASTCLPRELKQWKIFIDNWPLIAGLLQAAVQA